MFAALVCCAAACGIGGGDSNNGGSGGETEKPEFAGGTGTQADPYRIAEAYQWLNALQNPAADFILTADINLGDYKSVSPLGSSESPFTGTVDGKNHKITGAQISASSNAGLFGVISGATIKNLGFENSSVKMSSKNDDDVIASFVAVARKGTVIENCYSENVSINFTKYSTKYVMMGGFAGNVESVSSIVCCHCNVNIKAPDGSRFRIGGFARYVSGAVIDCCYAEGSISVWGPSGVKVCRIGTFVDTLVNGKVSNTYVEMSINAKGATGVYYFAGYVDEENLEFCLNFCNYQKAPNGKYETCKLQNNGSEYVNLYFSPSEYAYANDTLERSLWCDNKFWVKGKVHPQLVSYETYLAVKGSRLI